MSAKSKAAGAAMIAAPEAGAALKAAGAAKGVAAKGNKRPQKRLTPGTPPDEVNAELQRRRREAAAGTSSDEPEEPATPVASPPPASPGGGLPSIPMPAAASTGSGFLLGVFAWALGLAYLRGGSDEVKKFLAAKFFNKTGG